MRQVWKEKREEARRVIEEIQRDPDSDCGRRLEEAQIKMLSAIGSIKNVSQLTSTLSGTIEAKRLKKSYSHYITRKYSQKASIEL